MGGGTAEPSTPSRGSEASGARRLAQELMTTAVPRNCAGFSAADEPRVAVCLLPGTEVAFENKVERHLTGFQLFLRRTKVLPHRVARFRQVNMDNPCTHHDALEFPDGKIVVLTHLRAGQQATVLQLPAQPKNADAPQQAALPEARCVLNGQRDPLAG